LAPPRSARGLQGEIRSEFCSAGQIPIGGEIDIGAQILIGGQIVIAGEIHNGGQIRRGSHDNIHTGVLPGGACGDDLRVIGAEIPALLVRAIRRVPTRSQLWESARTLGLAGVPSLLRDTG
jgi:hypothetical protein